MGRQIAISSEAREYITDEIERRGLVEVGDIAVLVEKHYQFDPLKAREREIKAWARRLLGSLKAQDGTREVLAVKGSPGLFAHLGTCHDSKIVDAIIKQLTEKRNGLDVTLKMAERRKAEIEGQQSLFEATNG